MKSAEEILRTHLLRANSIWDEGEPEEFKATNCSNKILEAAMKEYAEDAIRECAERAQTKEEQDYDGCGGLYDYNVIDKESILSLIKELK